VLELVVVVEDGVQFKVDRPHVPGGHFRFEFGDDPDSFLGSHRRSSSRRGLDDDVRLLTDADRDLAEQVEIGDWLARLRIADVDMDDTRPRLGSRDCLLGDLLWRYGGGEATSSGRGSPRSPHRR
jgi:hypothetical protein